MVVLVAKPDHFVFISVEPINHENDDYEYPNLMLGRIIRRLSLMKVDMLN